MLGVERLDGIMEMLKDGQAVSITPCPRPCISANPRCGAIWPPCKRRG